MSRSYRDKRITPDDQQSSRFGAFKGLVNTHSRKDIGLDALYVADNVVLSDKNKIVSRAGFRLINDSGTVRGGFTVRNNVYIDVDGTLYRLVSDGLLREVVTGMTGRAYNVAEVNGIGYFTNGAESGMVRGDSYVPYGIAAPLVHSVVPFVSTPPPANMGDTYKTTFYATYETSDGREGPASDPFEVASAGSLYNAAVPPMYAKTHIYATSDNGTQPRRVATTVASVVTVSSSRNGAVLDDLFAYPVPEPFETIAFYNGRMYVSQYVGSADDQTIIWCSMSMAYHLYKYGNEYYIVPGRVLWMGRIRTGLLVITTLQILEIVDDALVVHAEYGGITADVDEEGTAYVWTARGVCTLPDFKNLTEETLSMPAGVSAACKIVHFNGMKQFITVTQGGSTPFNRREERT